MYRLALKVPGNDKVVHGELFICCLSLPAFLTCDGAMKRKLKTAYKP